MPTSACELMSSLRLCLPPEDRAPGRADGHLLEFAPLGMAVHHEQVGESPPEAATGGSALPHSFEFPPLHVAVFERQMSAFRARAF